MSFFKKLLGLKEGLDAKNAVSKIKEKTKEANNNFKQGLKKGEISPKAKQMKVRSKIVMYITIALTSLKGLASAFGYDIPLNEEAIGEIATIGGTGVMAYLLWNHVKSTDKIGLFGGDKDTDTGNGQKQ